MTTPEQAAYAEKILEAIRAKAFRDGVAWRDQNPSDAVRAKDAEILDLKVMLDGVEETAAKNEAYVAFELKQCQERVKGLVEALEGVERFVRISGECSHSIVYEQAALEHADKCRQALATYREQAGALSEAKEIK